MKIKDIAAAIENLVPRALALDWDNVGLLVGNREKQARKILMTIDITRDVIEEARAAGAEMILSYHPVIWDGLKSVTPDGPGAMVYELMKSNIAVYSIHTAYDIVQGGTNDLLAQILDLTDTRPIGDYVENPAGPLYKLITFVPENAADALAQALFEAGAGRIGNYSHCSFRTAGTGTFKPLEGARPAVGKRGTLETVPEIRLETMVTGRYIQAVIAAMRKAHPYETPAFDVLRHHDIETQYGLGRIGPLKKPLPMPEIIERVKKATGAKAVGLIGPASRTVKTAAVCAGSCGKIISALIAGECDLYLTGELKHHLALAASEAGLTCLCLSHTVSERFALKNLAARLKKALPGVTVTLSRKDKDPFTWKQL